MTVLWTALLMLGLLWPSRVLSLVAGAPLDGRVEALIVGLAVPVLCWLHPRFLANTLTRAAIVLLLVLKIAGSALLAQQGLCARFSTAAPYATEVLTIPVDEPSGALRSWDLRADWRAESPRCTAIVDRAYDDTSAFPAWFLNITASTPSAPPRPVAMDVTGYVTVRDRGLFVMDTGRPAMSAFEPGTHRVDLHAELAGDHWRLVPTWNGRDAFEAATLTVSEPRGIDRLAPAFGLLFTSLALLIVAGWLVSIVLEYRTSPALLGWCVLASALLVAVGITGRFERLAVLLLAFAIAVPVDERHRNLRGALMLVGVPWLALIAARSLPQIAHVSTYSYDDWLAYQVAGYRIYMNGFWLEGGSRLFDYQPLYRWITGALHLVFGDSSVGETYWDAVGLLLGGAVTFTLVLRVASFRWAIAAFVGTLATYWLGTIWYFVGRGLSEVSAAGWAFIAALILLSPRSSTARYGVLAGVFAVLMFYTRLNHLLFAFFLIALMSRFSMRAAVAYLATFAGGVATFALRTWWYTGHFSILYGTSLKNNDTGLRLTTMTSPAVWEKISHSLRALVWMNEPPAFDPRALLVVAGVLLSIAAVVLAPKASRVPLSIAVVTLGACASSFLAHTHNYPGRMSIHLAPFAVAMTFVSGAKALQRWPWGR